MGGKLAVATGLLTGAVVGGALVAGLVLLAPAPTPPVLATPSPSVQPSATPPSAPASSSPSSAPSSSGLVPLPSVSLPVPSPSASASGGVSAGDGGFLMGQPAPALSVKAIDGSTISLASLKGKPVWVNFMATWCPSCVDELPVMNGFAARFQANPDLHASAEAQMVSGEFVIQKEKIKGRAGKEALVAVTIYQVKAGKIVKMWGLRE